METNQQAKLKVKVWGGVTAILIWMFVIFSVTKLLISGEPSLETLDGFASMIIVSGLFFTFLYIALVKKYNLDPLKKFGVIVVSIILMIVSAAYLGDWITPPSPGLNAIDELSREIENKNYSEKEKEALSKSQKISEILISISDPPSTKQEAESYILKIDEVLSLTRENIEIIQGAHSILLSLLDKARTEEEREEIKEIIKANLGQNLDVLPEYSNQFRIHAEASIKNLEARKKYYQAYVNDEAESIQSFLLNEWDDAENIYLAEREKLLILQAKLIE